jgi:hypothetical protein
LKRSCAEVGSVIPAVIAGSFEFGGVAFILAGVGIELLHPKLKIRNSL